MSRRNPRSIPLSGILAILVLGFPGAAPADGPPGDGSPEEYVVSKTRVVHMPRSAADPPPAGPALRAVVDPATGALISPPAAGGPALPALDPRMERALSTSHYGLHPVHLPDGSVMVDLQGRFMSVLKARLGPDGTVSIHHAAAPGRCREPARTPGGPQAHGEEDR